MAECVASNSFGLAQGESSGPGGFVELRPSGGGDGGLRAALRRELMPGTAVGENVI